MGVQSGARGVQVEGLESLEELVGYLRNPNPQVSRGVCYVCVYVVGAPLVVYLGVVASGVDSFFLAGLTTTRAAFLCVGVCGSLAGRFLPSLPVDQRRGCGGGTRRGHRAQANTKLSSTPSIGTSRRRPRPN